MPANTFRQAVLAVSIVWLTALLSGCIAYRHVPPAPQASAAIPAVLQQRTAAVAPPATLFMVAHQTSNQQLRERASSTVATWFAAPVPGAEPDYRITLSTSRHGTHMGKFTGTFLLYLVTLGLAPAINTGAHSSELVISAGGQEIFRDVQLTELEDMFSMWGPVSGMVGKAGSSQPQAAVDYLMSGHGAALARRVAQDQGAFATVAAQGTAEAFGNYLAANPNSFFRGEALRGLSVLASRMPAPLAAHRANLGKYPDYIRFLADSEALWFVGPEGMRVMDIGPALQAGTAAELLAAQIRAAGKPYKVFSAAELGVLKSRGIPDTVVAAMLDATSASGHVAGMANSLAPASALPATSSVPAAPSAPALPGTAAAPKTAGDVAAECAKKFAAIKACEQIPSFGASVCKSQVNKKYASMACALVQ